MTSHMANLDFPLQEASGVINLTWEFVLEMESPSADAFQIQCFMFLCLDFHFQSNTIITFKKMQKKIQKRFVF